jgi:hypothetical protein
MKMSLSTNYLDVSATFAFNFNYSEIYQRVDEFTDVAESKIPISEKLALLSKIAKQIEEEQLPK